MAASSGSDRHLEEIRRIVLSHLEGREVEVYLFGSFARGEAGRGSDVDVAIDAKEPLPHDVIVRIRDALEESRVPYRVDVVDLSEADSRLAHRVREEGVAWT